MVLKYKVAEVEVLEIMATGFRAPNGMTVGPNDIINVSNHQGHWMPSSILNLILEDRFAPAPFTRCSSDPHHPVPIVRS